MSPPCILDRKLRNSAQKDVPGSLLSGTTIYQHCFWQNAFPRCWKPDFVCTFCVVFTFYMVTTKSPLTHNSDLSSRCHPHSLKLQILCYNVIYTIFPCEEKILSCVSTNSVVFWLVPKLWFWFRLETTRVGWKNGTHGLVPPCHANQDHHHRPEFHQKLQNIILPVNKTLFSECLHYFAQFVETKF